METTVRDTIKEITRSHLAKGNMLFGQCVSAVGWVAGTVPELTEPEGMIELSLADVMNGGLPVGAALTGMRPIYLVRFQGFHWYNSPIIANYAGKSKELWGVPCPIFIRSVALEGGIGPVASNSHHGIYYRMPGVDIVSPMTPQEYRDVYKYFMEHDDPMYVSEHRKSYDNTKEFTNRVHKEAHVVLFPFSVTRFEVEAAADRLWAHNISADIYHQLWIKPLKIPDYQIEALRNSKYGGIVLDDDYPNGVAKQIAYELMLKSGKPVRVLCLKEKAAGFQPHNDNFPPTAQEIADFVINDMIP